MSWDELVKVALIGTDRSNLSEATKKELSDLGIDTSKEATFTVLEGAALLSLMQKTGGFPKSWDKPIPEKSPEEKGVQCSKKSRNHLKLILKGTFSELLPEFVSHLAKNDKLLPLDYLPELLDQSLRNKELWKALKRVIGKRGHWLIGQNQEWQTLSFQPDPAIWEIGTREQRVQLLLYIREQKSAKAIPLIQSTWAQDDLQTKARFVQALEINPSKADEYFLEECLTNSRKEIRTPAAKILSSIPESRLCQRIFEQTAALMEYKPATLPSKEKLIIKLPEELTDDMLRDGIDPSSRWLKGGVKASRLGQMISIIPPLLWEQYFEKNAGEVLQLFVKSEWSELILQAVTEAGILHKNIIWAEEILIYWLEKFEKENWQYFKPIGLINVISPQVFNKVALLHINKKNSLADEESPLSLLLSNVNLPWQDALSIAFINFMQKSIAGESTHYWNGWHLRPILKKAAMYTNPELFDLLAKGWSSHSYAWNSWEKEVDSFLSVLKFRKDLIQELEVKGER
jgi:hypothetical protein